MSFRINWLWKKIPSPGWFPWEPSDPNAYTYEWHESAMQELFPVRFWLHHSLPRWYTYTFKKRFENIWYWIRTHTYNRYHMLDLRSPNNDYKWGWIDTDYVILCACFNALKNFVEGECPFERVDWDWSATHKHVAKEIKSLYKWWTVGRAKEQKALDKCRSRTYLKRDEEARKRDDDNLIRLMKIRHYLWT